MMFSMDNKWRDYCLIPKDNYLCDMNRKGSEYRLRPRSLVNVRTKYNLDDEDHGDEYLDDEYHNSGVKRPKRKCRNRPSQLEKDYNMDGNESDYFSESNVFDDNFILDRLPDDQRELTDMFGVVNEKIKYYKQIYLKEQEELKGTFQLIQANSHV